MTIRVDKKTGDVLLWCDGMFCVEHERLGGGFDNARTWIDANSWRAYPTAGGRWKHHCPTCDRLRQAPQAYWDRLTA